MPIDPASQVNTVFDRAVSYVNNAQGPLNTFTSALTGAVYSPPSITLAWDAVTPKDIPTVTEAPLPDYERMKFVPPAGGPPDPITEDKPTVDIDPFTDTPPTLSFATAPVLYYGAVPSVPAIGTVTVPDAPELDDVGLPSLLALRTVSIGSIDLHEDWLTKFDDIPTLELLAPTPYSYARGPVYASQLLDTLKAQLVERLAGGTGLKPAVEQAIWDRARSRETQISLANEAEIMRNSEALGFQLPTGVLAAQLRQAQQDYYDKLSTLSRDVAIKQAELEQENLKQTIAQGMELEGKLIDYSYKLEQLTFETAKVYAENAIQVHNASVEQFKAMLSGYQAYEAAYKTIIESELAKIEVYKAELSGEQTKAQINTTLVQQYKAQIEARMAAVEIYRAQVGAAQTLVQLEQAKIGAAGEQIKAYVAQVGAETAKVEAYKASVQAEVSKVEVYKAQTQAYSAKTSAKAEEARAQISWFNSLIEEKQGEWQGYKTKIEAEVERIKATGLAENVKLEYHKAQSAAAIAQGQTNAEMYRANIHQAEVQKNLAMQQAKINTDVIMQTNNARLDAAKTGAQVYAQLVGSAYSMMNASASISGSGSTSVSYSYSNDTTGEGPVVTSA